MLMYMVRENTALVLSALAAGLFALAGISWGLWLDSLVILFDGGYSLVSLALSGLALYASRVMRRPACARYPFGRGAIEPLVIAVKGLVIALVCLLSLVSAVVSLLNGGRDVSAGLALVFAGISAVVCLMVWLYLLWVGGRRSSGLLEAERRQWFMDTVLSVAVLAGFGLADWLAGSAWSAWAIYADPTMMVVISAYFILVPVKMVVGAVRELMLAAPSKALSRRVHQALAAEGISPEQVKMAKVGSSLMLEISLPAGWPGKLAKLKQALARKLQPLPVKPAIFIHGLSS